MNKKKLLIAGSLLAVLATWFSTAARAEEDAHQDTHIESGHSATHPFHTHTLGLFVGGSGETGGVLRENGFAIGLEYEYRFNASFGVGAVAEHTYGDINVWVYAVPFAYHNGPWKMYVAPGIEDSEEGNDGLLRIGVEYGFHVGKWEISPQIDLDFVERRAEVVVVGLVFARGFNL